MGREDISLICPPWPLEPKWTSMAYVISILINQNYHQPLALLSDLSRLEIDTSGRFRENASKKKVSIFRFWAFQVFQPTCYRQEVTFMAVGDQPPPNHKPFTPAKITFMESKLLFNHLSDRRRTYKQQGFLLSTLTRDTVDDGDCFAHSCSFMKVTVLWYD